MFNKEELEVIGNLLLEARISGRQSGLVATIISKIAQELQRPEEETVKEDE